MNYLELRDIEFSEDALKKAGYISNRELWEDLPVGAYIVSDGALLLLAIWNREFVNTQPLPVNLVSSTKPTMDEDMIYNHLVVIEHQLQKLSDRPIAKDNVGLSGDILIKALAVAQKPELAKDL